MNDNVFAKLAEFVSEHGHAAVPQTYETDDGYALGRAVNSIRDRRGWLDPYDEVRLSSLPGWSWGPTLNKDAETLAVLRRFVDREGHAKVPRGHKELGVSLHSRIVQARRDAKAQTADPDLIHEMEKLGVNVDPKRSRWFRSFQTVMAEAMEHGDATYRHGHTAPNGLDCGAWATSQRYRQRKGELDATKTVMLETLPGWTTEKHGRHRAWSDRYQSLARALASHGVRAYEYAFEDDSGFRTGEWATQQRSAWRRGELSMERARRLEKLPWWSWEYRQSAKRRLRGDGVPDWNITVEDAG